MNKIIPVIAIVFAFTLGTIFSADIATALKPATEVFVTNTEPILVTGISSSPVCPTENVQHWANYHFKASGTITHPTLPPFGGSSVLEIQVPTDEKYTDHGVIVAKLTELGYLDATSQTLEPSDIFETIARA